VTKIVVPSDLGNALRLHPATAGRTVARLKRARPREIRFGLDGWDLAHVDLFNSLVGQVLEA
jgi:hypothetical protein